LDKKSNESKGRKLKDPHKGILEGCRLTFDSHGKANINEDKNGKSFWYSLRIDRRTT